MKKEHRKFLGIMILVEVLMTVIMIGLLIILSIDISNYTGEALESLKTRLSKMSEKELKKSLAKALGGEYFSFLQDNNISTQQSIWSTQNNYFNQDIVLVDKDDNITSQNLLTTQPVQQVAIDKLSSISRETQQIIDAHDAESGLITWIVNGW